jgi:hypothetical protein
MALSLTKPAGKAWGSSGWRGSKGYGRGTMERKSGRRTENHDIKDQNDEAKESSTSAVFPRVAVVMGCGECFLSHGEGHKE